MRIPARSRLLVGSGRTAGAVALLVPVLALTAACGGGGDGKGGKPAPQGVRASGAVSTANLTQALLTSKDVPDVQVLPAGSKEQLLGGRQQADRPQCQAVADQWSSQPAHPRQVYVGAMVTDTADKDKNAKTISLSVVASYTAGEAKAVLDDLAASLRTCTTYSSTRNGTTTTFAVKSVPATGTWGDQQVTYTIGDTKAGQAGTVLVTVVRVGDTTAAYETLRADHKPATLRAAIALKQVDKLRQAAKETPAGR